MSAKLASKTKFYMDFKPLTFGPFLKKTLYLDNLVTDKQTDGLTELFLKGSFQK